MNWPRMASRDSRSELSTASNSSRYWGRGGVKRGGVGLGSWLDGQQGMGEGAEGRASDFQGWQAGEQPTAACTVACPRCAHLQLGVHFLELLLDGRKHRPLHLPLLLRW